MLRPSLLAVLSLLPPANEWEEHRLDNGLEVTLIHVPGSPRQHCFVLYPTGLLADLAGRCQFAHLVEHMLIRSTDAEGLQAGGVGFNGETGPTSMRLDTYAEPASYREGLERQARWMEEWLEPGAIDPALLAREKGVIAQEEAQTLQGGFTHKWADAAWAQVVRHGREHAALHGDVARATPEAVQAYAREQGRELAGVRIVSLGPVPTTETLEVIEDLFSRLGPGRPGTSVGPRLNHEAPAHREATWDLEARHYIEWYRWPEESVKDRLAAAACAQVLAVRLGQDPTLRAQKVQATAAVDLIVPELRALKISLSVPDGVEKTALERHVASIVAGVRDGSAGQPSLAQLVPGMASELSQVPDLAALREQHARLGQAHDLLEGNVILGLVMLEQWMGVRREELAAVAATLTAEEVMQRARRFLATQRRESLWLKPEGR